MRKIVFSVSALLAGSAFLNSGTGLLGTVVALRMAVAEFPVLIAGFIVSVYFIGYVLGVFYSHRLIDGVGHIRTFAALASILSATSLMHPFLVSPVPWGALRFAQGFCLAGLAMCTESWLNERATNEIRGRILSVYMIVIYVAQVAGQLLLAVPDSSGYGLFVISSALLSLSLVPVAITRVEAPTPKPPSRFGFRELWKISPIGVAGSAASGVIVATFYGLMPYFAQMSGFGTLGTSQLMAAGVVGGLVFQWPVGRFSDRVDRRLVLAVVAAVAALASAAVASALMVPGWQDVARWVLLGLSPILGGAVFTLYPLSAAHTNDHVDPADLVSASAGLILAYGLGAIIGPPVASGLMGVMGPVGLFVFFAACGLVMALFAFWRISRREALPVDERDPFQLVTRTTPMATELHPSAEPEEPTFDLVMPEEKEEKEETESENEKRAPEDAA